jgi:hypothetical protein
LACPVEAAKDTAGADLSSQPVRKRQGRIAKLC